MRLISLLVLAFLLPACAFADATITVMQPYTNQTSLLVTASVPPAGYASTLNVYDSCAGGGPSLGSAPLRDKYDGTKPIEIAIAAGNLPLKASSTLCVIQTFNWTAKTPEDKAKAPKQISSNTVTVYDPTSGAVDTSAPCAPAYNDCGWHFQAIAGVEQSDLSSQTSQTDPFVSIFVRTPDDRGASVWGEIRFLGAPSNSSTQNVAAAATNPSGTVTSSSLSTVGYAVDYVLGAQLDNRHTKTSNGQFSLSLIAGLGATTPITSQTATVAYSVPDYGSNECSQLQQRFTTASGYSPALPASASIVTTTTVGSNSPTSIGSPTYCVVQQIPTSTIANANGTTTSVTNSGTQIKYVAFAPQDRSNFLFKYGVGVRIIDRRSSSGHCSANDCSRSVTDLTVGQDESFTGGYLRRFVFKTNINYPVGRGVYLYGSASIRLAPNVNLSPLLLSQVPIATSAGAAVAGSVTIPSDSVFVLPLKQANRDFYRVGIAVDLCTVLTKLCGTSTGASN